MKTILVLQNLNVAMKWIAWPKYGAQSSSPWAPGISAPLVFISLYRFRSCWPRTVSRILCWWQHITPSLILFERRSYVTEGLAWPTLLPPSPKVATTDVCHCTLAPKGSCYLLAFFGVFVLGRPCYILGTAHLSTPQNFPMPANLPDSFTTTHKMLWARTSSKAPLEFLTPRHITA